MSRPRQVFEERGERHRREFLKNYERCGFIKEAMRAVGISHCNHYQWLATNPGYAEEFDRVHELVIERLGPRVESEIVSRAIEGEETLVIHNGQPVLAWADESGQYVPPPADPKNPGNLRLVLYRERVKSDRLLVVLARRLMPEYVEESKIDHTSGGKPIQLGPIKLEGEKEV
jgi:hypothetical protein